MSIRTQLGKRIREEREKADLTQEELAEMVGISQNFLACIERNIKQCRLETIEGIADALHVPLDRMFLPSRQGPPDRDVKLIAKLRPFLKDGRAKNEKVILKVIALLQELKKL